jgi:hypothetical protein
MNPIEKIKKGIEENSWDLVVEGFNQLTGMDLVPPAPLPQLDNEYKELLFFLKKKIDAALEGQVEEEFPAEDVLIRESRRLSARAEPKEYRQEINYVNVVCNLCQKADKVHPRLAPQTIDKGEKSKYTCNDCLRK